MREAKDVDFGAFSEEALQEVRESRLLINRVDEWLVEELTPYLGSRIIEIGCGMGNLMHHFMGREFVYGIDVSESSIRRVQSDFEANNNIIASVADITDRSVLQLAGYEFDTAVTLNVFEHIRDDRAGMDHARQLLRPGGRFIIAVPAHMRLYGSMDRSIGHYRRYSKADLSEKLQSVGLEVVSQKYLNMAGVFGWYVNGKWLHRRVPPIGQLKLFNSFVPAIRMVENLVPAPFGLTLLVIARRPV